MQTAQKKAIEMAERDFGSKPDGVTRFKTDVVCGNDLSQARFPLCEHSTYRGVVKAATKEGYLKALISWLQRRTARRVVKKLSRVGATSAQIREAESLKSFRFPRSIAEHSSVREIAKEAAYEQSGLAALEAWLDNLL